MITYNGHSRRIFPRKNYRYELILITQQDRSHTVEQAQNLANQLNMEITAFAPREDEGFGMDHWTVRPDCEEDTLEQTALNSLNNL